MSNDEKKYEYVSALMDDELSEADLALMLEDDEAQQKWREYHVIRDYMQHAKLVSSEEFEIEANAEQLEPVVIQDKKADIRVIQANAAANSKVFRLFAVAASVCALAVAVWQVVPQADQAAPMAAEKQVIEPVVGDQNIVPVGKIKQDDKATQKEVVEPNAALVSNMDTQKVEPAILTSKIEDEKTKQASEPEKIQ
ncbi:MAG: sigma-E factor negative regulatory protein [Neisseria sp.]